MSFDLADTVLLQHLETLAAQIGIEIRYEDLADDELFIQSGGCRALGKNLILIERLRSPRERAQILARELSKCDLEELYILPRVRDFIDLQALPREKKRP
jgi:hypothetical protein